MSNNDSFIEEVTEEVRRDKLFALYRKWGWIPILLVLLVVGGAAYNEWRKASAQAAAEALGDAVMTALEVPDAPGRAAALANVPADGSGAETFLALLRAASEAEASDRDGALAQLDAIADRADVAAPYRELAQLKAVILRGSDQDRSERMAMLEHLSRAGAPFRVLAMEQKALALYEFGNNDEAIAVLRMVLEEPNATQGLLQRAQQLIVAMGGSLSDGNEAGTEG